MSSSKSIAVLPFLDLSPRKNQEYFCDGMTEEIINALCRVEGLQVSSRTSSFYFKEKNLPIPEIGQSLNVSTILEGSIRFADDQMRLTAQLIDVKSDTHFFSEVFDRPLSDVFAVQDEVSLLIADRLREELGHLEIEDHLVTAPSISIEAYQTYLEARYSLLKMNRADLNHGIQLLESIIPVQPNFTRAYLAIHLGYTLLGTIGFLPAVEAFSKGQPYLEKAIQLEPELPECQLQLSYIAFLQNWDIAAAYDHLNRSRAIRPLPEFYQSMASILVAEGQFSAATTYIKEALQIDPFSNINYHLQGFIHYCQEDYDLAIKSFKKSKELGDTFSASTLYLGQAMLLSGQAEAALQYFQDLADDPSDLLRQGGITMAQAVLGQRAAAEAGLAELEKAREDELLERSLFFQINCHVLLGNTEQALTTIDQALAMRLPMSVYLFVDPLLQSLRQEARFQAAMISVLGEKRKIDFQPKKYQQPLFSPKELVKQQERLQQFMAQETPYLNPKLSLRELANKMDLPPNHLSQLLNEGFEQNFSAFINDYRLAAFKAKAADPELGHYSILALALDSGFNSKTAFNAYFKKSTGRTPSAYCRSIGRE